MRGTKGTAVLVADLEGVPGVGRVEDLVAGATGHEGALRAAARHEAEVSAAVEAAGWAITARHQTHRAGEAGGAADAGDRLRADLSAADAAVFVGMHAPAGALGFAAHTFDLFARWSAGGPWLSELEVMLAVCSQAGTRALLVTGEEGLLRHLQASGWSGVPFIVTTRAEGPLAAVPRSPLEVQRELRQIARRSAAPPRLPGPGAPEVTLRWAAQWPMRWAVEHLGVQALGAAPAAGPDGVLAQAEGPGPIEQAELQIGAGDATAVRVAGPSWAATWARAEAIVDAIAAQAEPALGQGSDQLVQGTRQATAFDSVHADLRDLLCMPSPSLSPGPSLAEGALLGALEALEAAFLASTAAGGEAANALRGLVLSMLQAHAPALYAARGLEGPHRAVRSRLAQAPLDLPVGLDPDLAVARVDAAWLSGRGPPALELEAYLEALVEQDELLYAYVIAETARLAGVQDALRFRGRPLEGEDPLGDLYWLTHQVLFETEFLLRPASARPRVVETFRLAAPRLAKARHLDLLAELTICLSAMAEPAAARAAGARLLAAVPEHGRIQDADPEAVARADHTIGATWVALAGLAQGWAG